MKKLSIKSKRSTTAVIVTCILFTLFVSCIKKSTPAPPVAQLSVIDASPGSPSLNFYLDNNRVNSGPFSYTNQLGYFNAYAGSRNAYITNSSTGAKLASSSINLQDSRVYSLFITDTLKNIGFLLITDSIAAPPSGKANIRFVHLSPDAPAVDLAVTNGKVLFSNKAYKGYTSFSSIPGDSTYSFDIRPTGKATAITTLTGVKIEKNKVYTIWLNGLVNTAVAGEKIGGSVITNAQY